MFANSNCVTHISQPSTFCTVIILYVRIPPPFHEPLPARSLRFARCAQCAARAHRQAQKLLGLYRATKSKAALLAAKVEVRTAGGGVEVLRCDELWSDLQTIVSTLRVHSLQSSLIATQIKKPVILESNSGDIFV